jgi:hypothetical protein
MLSHEMFGIALKGMAFPEAKEKILSAIPEINIWSPKAK